MFHDTTPLAAESAALLKINHATVIRNGNNVLHDLTFEIREGEHTAIVGPNGGGKSFRNRRFRNG